MGLIAVFISFTNWLKKIREAEYMTHCVMFWGPVIDPLFPKLVSLAVSPSQF